MERNELELLVLQPTPFCNLDCSYCYLPDRLNRSRMSLDTLQRAAEVVLEMGTLGDRLEIAWHAGEPLSVPIDWYTSAHSILSRILGHDRIRFSFYSNGTLISKNWVEFIKGDPRIRITLSIDGPARFHNARRRSRSGKGTHQQALLGAQALLTGGIPFNCLAVLIEEALDHPDELFRFFSDLGPALLGFNVEELDGANLSSSLIGSPQCTGHLERRYRTFVHRFSELTLREAPFQLRGINSLVQALGSLRLQNPEAHCNQLVQPWRVISISSTGDLHTFSPELLGVTIPRVGTCLGNIHRHSWSQIASSDRFIRLRDEIALGVAQCRSECRYFSICGGGAPSNKLAEHGSFSTSETSHCRYTVKAQFDESARALRSFCVDQNSSPRPP